MGPKPAAHHPKAKGHTGKAVAAAFRIKKRQLIGPRLPLPCRVHDRTLRSSQNERMKARRVLTTCPFTDPPPYSCRRR